MKTQISKPARGVLAVKVRPLPPGEFRFVSLHEGDQSFPEILASPIPPSLQRAVEGLSKRLRSAAVNTAAGWSPPFQVHNHLSPAASRVPSTCQLKSRPRFQPWRSLARLEPVTLRNAAPRIIQQAHAANEPNPARHDLRALQLVIGIWSFGHAVRLFFEKLIEIGIGAVIAARGRRGGSGFSIRLRLVPFVQQRDERIRPPFHVAHL